MNNRRSPVACIAPISLEGPSFTPGSSTLHSAPLIRQPSNEIPGPSGNFIRNRNHFSIVPRPAVPQQTVPHSNVPLSQRFEPHLDEAGASSGAEELQRIEERVEAHREDSRESEPVRKRFRKVRTDGIKRQLPHSSDESDARDEGEDVVAVDSGPKTDPLKRQKLDHGQGITCSMCDKVLSTAFSMKRHKRLVHGIKA